ncbi:RNA-dependent RNA polymerase [Erysiphe necator associated deltaflexivirus 3]|nr:RNA-dependent RNA polymerase [Erysiphe necator associated deltaflexivirus 3]
MIRLDPTGGMSPLQDPRALREFFRPVVLPIRVVVNLLLILILVPVVLAARVLVWFCIPTFPFTYVRRPETPGRCWWPVLALRGHLTVGGIDPFEHPASFSRDTLDTLYFGEVLHDWLSAADVRRFALLHSPWPFVRIIRIAPGVFHILPGKSYHGRLHRVSRLPAGWYGAGSLDPNFYADSPLKSVILSMHMGAYGKTLSAARQQCPYDVPTPLRPLLREAGISDPPPHAETHSHPVHYALRNKYMALAAKSLQGRWYALFAGDDRINYLRSCGATAPVGVFSPRYEGKDITRYRGQPVPTDRGLPLLEPRSDAPVWYVCDSLHHMSASTVGSWFDKNPTLEYVVATTIIPPETLWNLPSLCQALYTYTVKGNRVTYIPEGHVGSAYVQPLSGNRWLRTDALITPRNTCVHVSLLAQDYAHQLIVISRAPLLPQESRLMCIRNVSIIPWFVHPLGTLYQRLTSPGLNRALQSYITRVGSTSIRDIYSKSTATEVAVFARYPQSFVRAGALYAKWIRDIDYHSATSGFTYVRWVFTMLTRVPVIPFRWWFQSYTSVFSQMNQDEPDNWEIECSTWVSQVSDDLLPGLRAQVCPNKMTFWQLQPDADRLSRFASVSARVGAWLFLKVLGVASWPLIRYVFQHVSNILEELLYVLDLHWNTSPMGIIFTVFVMWCGVTGPSINIKVPSFGWIKTGYYNSFVVLYQLPSIRHTYRVGVSWFYCLLLNFSIITLALPHAHPLIYYLDHVRFHDHVGLGNDLEGHTPLTPHSPYLRPIRPGDSNLEPGFNISQVFVAPGTIDRHALSHDIGYSSLRIACNVFNVALLILAYLWVSRFFSGMLTDYRPIHDVEAHNDIDCGSVCHLHTPAPPSSSEGSNDDGNGDSYQGISLPLGLEATGSPPRSVASDSLYRPATPIPPAAPLPADPQPNVPLPFLPVQVPGDPLGAYDLPPRVIGDFPNWRNLMTRLPDPPNQLDPNNMCVWDVLSSHLGVRAPVVWGCYVSSLPFAHRANYAVGFVPPEDLSQVMTFFACTYIIRGALANGVCPRGPGGVAPPCHYDPAIPPHAEGAGLPGFPSFTVFLQNNQDGSFHFSNVGVVVQNIPAFVPPTNADWIGWVSRLVPDVEVGEVVNLPAKGFATVYRRLVGNMANPLSMFQMGTRLQNFVLPAVPVQGEIVVYTPNARDAGYARALASDFKAKPIALDLTDFSPIDASRTLDQMAKQYDNFVRTGTGLQYPNVTFHIYHGVGGGGKTFRMIQDLAAAHQVTPFTPSNIMFHTADHNLRSRFMSDVLAALPNVGLQNNHFMTSCVPLVRPAAGTVVFDDVGLTYNSFLPLFMAANPGVTDIWLTFDCAQGQGVIPTANAISRSHPATKDWLSPMSSRYGTEVIRWSQDTADLYGFPRVVVPGRIAPRGKVTVVSQSPHDVPLLAVSPRFTQTQSMGGQVANTFQECQGHTIHGDVCVDLGGLTATCTDTSAWTALTRPTGHTFLKMGPMMSTQAVVETSWAKSQILTALLTVATIRQSPYVTAQMDIDGLVRAAVYSHLARNLSPAACLRLGLPAPNAVIGATNVKGVYRAGWLNNSKASDYYTARTYRAECGVRGASGTAFSRHTATVTNSASPVADIVRHFTNLDPEAVLHTDSTGYQLPDAQPITAQPDPVDDINEPMDDVLRETSLPDNPHFLTFQHISDGAPDALHHTRADKVTDILGQRKRIRIGKHDRPWSSTDARRLRSLKRGFGKFFDMDTWLSEPENFPLMEQCESEKLASWASKRTKKTLVASIAKQDLDQQYTFTRIFPKGQYIKKKAKWRCSAFASQTVSDFHLGRIFRDAPRALFLEKMALKHAFSSTYLHCRASPDDLSRWYRDNWNPGVMTGNDYTAWDSGIDHVFLEFDLWLMEVCHFPLEYRERFRFERLNTHSYLGNHLPRQESGDRWTWILNTLRNAALTGASLDCPRRTPVCISGDDSVTLGSWRKTTGFNPSEWLMVPKREEGVVMEFCGLIFGGPDVSFDPAVVHWRSRFGLQQGRADADYWLSIRQAIVECSSKLGTDSPKLAGALLNLRRAILWFNLPESLDIPDPPKEPTHLVDSFVSFVYRLLRIISPIPY